MAENRPFLDFKAIKGRVAIADVLARYKVNLVRVNQTSFKGTCPLPTLIRKQEYVLRERNEIGLVLPLRFVQEERPAGRRERHRFRFAHGAVFRLCCGEADR